MTNHEKIMDNGMNTLHMNLKEKHTTILYMMEYLMKAIY